MFCHCSNTEFQPQFYELVYSCFHYCLLCFDEAVLFPLSFTFIFVSFSQKLQNMLYETNYHKPWNNEKAVTTSKHFLEKRALAEKTELPFFYRQDIWLFWLSFKSHLFPWHSLCSLKNMRNLSCNEMPECEACFPVIGSTKSLLTKQCPIQWTVYQSA